jgi:hypothetical protein
MTDELPDLECETAVEEIDTLLMNLKFSLSITPTIVGVALYATEDLSALELQILADSEARVYKLNQGQIYQPERGVRHTLTSRFFLRRF